MVGVAAFPRFLSAATTNRLLTGSADTTAKLWDVETGKELFNFPHKVRRLPQDPCCDTPLRAAAEQETF